MIGLGTPRSAGKNFECTWEHLGGPAIRLGALAIRLGASVMSLGAPTTSLGAPQ